MLKIKPTQAILTLLLMTLILFLSACGASGSLSYTPPIPFPPITISIDTNGNISLHATAALVTEVGTFAVEANVYDNLQPENNVLLLVIRHNQNGKVVDDEYRIQTGQDEVRVTTNGTTTVDVTQHKVFIDSSNGSIQSIEVKDANSQSTTTSSSSAFTPLPTPIPPTPTPLPRPGTVLYQADWSNGMNGWFNGSSQWNIVNSMLVSNSKLYYPDFPDAAATAPYKLDTIPDYAVEAQMQFVSCAYDHDCGFGIFLRWNNQGGYVGGMDYMNYGKGYAGIADIHTDHAYVCPTCGYMPVRYTDYAPGTNWSTYRIEVKGNDLKLFIDSALVVEVTDNTYLSGGQAGVESYNDQMNVRSFKIIAL